MDHRQLTFEFLLNSAKSAADARPPSRPKLEGQTVYVVDAHALIYQVFHGMPDWTGPGGEPVGAVHGFVRDVGELLRRYEPDYLLCAFDAPGLTFRHEMYDQYKVHREAMPDDLQLQIEPIHRFLAALAIPVLEMPGYEADDILATVARLSSAAGARCRLVTGDKDCRQLVDDQVQLLNLRTNQVWDIARVQSEWGIRPDQVVDFQALWGDSTDNIPGVAGVGKKTAGELLQQFGTIEGIYENLEHVRGEKRRETFLQGRDDIALSRKLVELDRDVPIRLNWEAARVGGCDLEALHELCQEFGLRPLDSAWAGVKLPAAAVDWTSEYRLIQHAGELRELVGQLAGRAAISIDTETTSTHPCWAEIVGYSLGWGDGQAAYIPVRGPLGETTLEAGEVAQILRPLLADPGILKIGQNLKYDLIVLRAEGLQLAGPWFDTMVADYLIDPGQRNHSLDELARRHLGHHTTPITDLIGKGRQPQRMDEIPLTLVSDYACEDADVPWRLHRRLAAQLRTGNLSELFDELEMPLIEVLADLEQTGIRVEVQRLQDLSDQFGRQLTELAADIFELAGESFNVDSPSQLARVFFERLQLPIVKRTKTGPSTDAAVLRQLSGRHPIVDLVTSYRHYAKLKSTYLDALPQLVHPVTGRVHTSFKQDVTATGRLSSSEPNLQNIPVRTRLGKKIRSAFRPGPDRWKLLAADYSQIELRVLAHLSGDHALRTAFREDGDIHRQVAAEVYGVAGESVTSDMRHGAKAINFGIIYGQSAFGLSQSLGISQDDAARFIHAYFEKYPGVLDFIDRLLDDCRRQGLVTTAFGRRRAIHGVRDAGRRHVQQRNMPERIAINTVIQGTAADLIKRAMLRIHRRIRTSDLQAAMLLQIHDELLFEVAPDDLDELSLIVREEMAAAGELAVPLKIDLKFGNNWGECEPPV